MARWVVLTEERAQSTQPVSKPQGGRPEGGIKAASRDLGINREDARRATKVAGLSDEANETAREVGLNLIDSRPLASDRGGVKWGG